MSLSELEAEIRKAHAGLMAACELDRKLHEMLRLPYSPYPEIRAGFEAINAALSILREQKDRS